MLARMLLELLRYSNHVRRYLCNRYSGRIFCRSSGADILSVASLFLDKDMEVGNLVILATFVLN